MTDLIESVRLLTAALLRLYVEMISVNLNGSTALAAAQEGVLNVVSWDETSLILVLSEIRVDWTVLEPYIKVWALSNRLF